MKPVEDSLIYHIYPLGLCGAPAVNDFQAEPVARLEKLYSWLDHLQWLGADAVILGPVFESRTHGYDTVDYFQVDRRLGTDETLQKLISEMHTRGIRVMLDVVFNHVGRNFPAFEDVQLKLEKSSYWNWFSGMRMDPNSTTGDPFTYEGWHGHTELVRLDTSHSEVRQFLFSTAGEWIRRYEIDGFRLDAADCLDMGFVHELARLCRALRDDFWLMGEVVFGDYNDWIQGGYLDSVTNYQAYKALYSSMNEGNCFELAHALEREFGREGLYTDLALYNFVDNHDVDRIASNLLNPAHLPIVFGLLFTIPGIPSIYYGSEWGQRGKKLPRSDHQLRPELDLDTCIRQAPEPDLPGWIKELNRLRSHFPVLRMGMYQTLLLKHEQFIFSRSTDHELAVAAVNTADQDLQLSFNWAGGEILMMDAFNNRESLALKDGKVDITLPAYSFRLFLSDAC